MVVVVIVFVCVSEWAGSESGGYGHWATARCADFLKERKRCSDGKTSAAE